MLNAGTVVARVRMTKMTEVAYGAALKAIVDRCNRENKCDLAQVLKGIIVDWASAQIAGLKDALGEERAEELLRGCKVSMLNSVCTRPAGVASMFVTSVLGPLYESSSACC